MREDEILDHLDFMLESVELIEKRFSRIRLPEDFVLSFRHIHNQTAGKPDRETECIKTKDIPQSLWTSRKRRFTRINTK